jgi:hypothetical protein
MSLSTFFGFGGSISSSNVELPDIFPLNFRKDLFIDTDVMNVYSKILTDCVSRTHGIPEDVFPLLWDNCLQSEATKGLITLVSEAMTAKADLFLVYSRSVNLVRVATQRESEQIRSDYKQSGSSAVGIYVSFKNYNRTEMIKLYSAMEYCVISSLNKMMNLSKAIQFKMGDMRGSVSLVDSEVALEQGQLIARALSNGKDVLLDSKDEIFTATPDLTSINQSIAFLDSKKCFYYGFPVSYINGVQTGGIGSTGEGDMRAVERGLKQYFVSILKPILDALFQITVSFKSSDFRQMDSALEAIKTFELVGTELISQDDKRMIISKLFDLETV